MEIKGKIYCFFEQSGTFKNEFRKLGYEAEDYDIQNEYGQTDHVCDLFAEIERGYDGKPSIFDEITPDDLVMAFSRASTFHSKTRLFLTGQTIIGSKIQGAKSRTSLLIERERERSFTFYCSNL